MTEEVIASLTGREFMPAAVSVAGLEEIGTIRENTQTGTDAGDRPPASLKRVRERNE